MTRERFIELVKEEQGSLRRFLLGLCGGDKVEADDMAQDALMRAYVASGSFLGLSKFRTWLFRIAYNCYLDRKRKYFPEKVSIEASAVKGLSSCCSADGSFKYQLLYKNLERLPEKEKACLVLHYFEDLPIKEISAVLKIPAGTVKYHLSTGRNRLKQYISYEGE